MKKNVIFGVLCIVLLNFQACKVTDKNRSNSGFIEDNEAVKKLYLSSIAAFNEGNIELFLANFASEIKMYGTDGTYFGHEALRDRFEVLFKQFPKMKMEIPDLNSEVLAKNVVLVNFKWKLYPMGEGPAFTGIGSGIYKRVDGQWVEILEVETVIHVDEMLKQG